MTRSLVPSDYQRTRIIGFSVTHAWWDEFRAAIPNPSAWELRWYSGGSIDIWANPDHVAWTYSGDPVNTGGLINPVGGSDNPNAVDRVIINVSGLNMTPANGPVLHPPGGYSSDVTEWKGYLESTIANVRSRFPNVRMILLQPNIGGPGDQTCSAGGAAEAQPSNAVRCTWTNPFIRSAITSVCKGNVRMGYAPFASACSDFTDWSGHIATSAETGIGTAIANYYANNL